MMEVAAQTGRGRWMSRVIAALLCLSCIATYMRVPTFNFVPFDDDIEILPNTHIRSLGLDNLKWMFTDTSQTERYTPLAWVVWACLYQVWGLNPAAFHGLELGVHVVNTLLVFVLLRSFLRRIFADPPLPVGVDGICAGMGALLWSVHPLRVQVVSWVAQDRFSEATIFVLLTVLCYLTAWDRGSYRTGYFWLSVALFSISLLFYPNGIGLLFILPILDIYPLRRVKAASLNWRSGVRLLVEKIPFGVPAVFVGAMTIYGRLNAAPVGGRGVSLDSLSFTRQLMQAVYIFNYYLWKPFAPFHISPVYTTLIHFDPLSSLFLINLAVFVLLMVLAVLAWRRYPAITLIWIAYFALVMPFGGYFELQHFPSDRYSYLEAVLWSVLLSAGLAWLWVKVSRRIVYTVLALMMGVGLALGVISNLETRAWADGESLFQHMLIELGPDPYRAAIDWRLGDYYVRQGRYAEALPLFEESFRLRPDDMNVRYAEGFVLIQLADAEAPGTDRDAIYLRAANDLDEAARALHTTATMKLAGYAYEKIGRLGDAEDRLMRVISIDPKDTQTRLLLANMFHQHHKEKEAIEEMDAAVRIDPQLAGDREAMLKSWSDAGAASKPGHGE